MIEALHRQDFEPVTAPVAPAPPPIDVEGIRDKHRKAARAGMSLFDRRGRAGAKAAAEQMAQHEVGFLTAQMQRAHQQQQGQLDAWWASLQHNEPETVIAVLAEAFEDNEAAAAPLGVADDEASLVVLVPAEDAVPQSKPATTSAGNLTLKKITKSEAADWYRVMVSGYMLATVKEALAVAPGLASVGVVALRAAAVDAYGRPRGEVILAARVKRQSLVNVRWQSADATRVLFETADEVLADLAPRTRALQPLSTSAYPDLAAAIAAVDLNELTQG